MPGKVKVKIICGRNLPVMDRSSDTTDAYVEIKLGTTTYKTDVCRKSLHPQWNSEWYKFEVDDSELQDEPLQIRLMDHDTYSANDAIGKVYLDLNPLLLPASLVKFGHGEGNHEPSTNSIMSGWIPVYDTMHGIRGEVNVIVKVELFSDFNRFRQSSCGIQFFCSKSIPHGFFAQNVHGFVEELIVNDDPEYQWIDKIRTPRASNEARQTLFFKLSGELQRKIGLKALDLGGNAVIGYCQCFDLEGESGIVARGIGTAVTLIKLIDVHPSSIAEQINDERAEKYLKFLGSHTDFRLNASPYSKPANNLSSPFFTNLPSLDIDNPRYKVLPKHYTDFQHRLRSTQSNPTLHDHIQHPSVKTLLRQEDMRGTPGYGLSQRLRNLKYSSQSMLSKKMFALKARLGDSGIGEEMDAEEMSAAERRRQFRSGRSSSDASVMAELLARSVIHAHNSLTCILESQDSCKENAALDDDDETAVDPEPNVIYRSEPLLSVQSQTVETESSNPSSSPSSSSSNSISSDDDNRSTFKDESNENFDTVSNIVRNVEIIEQNYALKKSSFSKQLSLPAMTFDDECEEENPFIFPNEVNEDLPSNDEEMQKVEDELPGNYLETLKAPIAKIESSDEELSRASPTEVGKRGSKTIIPPVMIGADLKCGGLMKTAMQTILLDKVNIMGTYTPPMSPVAKMGSFSLGSPTSASSTSSIAKSPVYPASTTSLVGASVQQLPRSQTAVSLGEWGKERETVLGAPFVSMHNIRRQQSHPCISHHFGSPTQACLSDSELNKSGNQENINRNKLSFIHLLSRGGKMQRTESHDNLPKRKFSFLHLSRRKSHEPQSNAKQGDDATKTRFSFLKRRRIKSCSENEKNKSRGLSNLFHKQQEKNEADGIKRHGLLGTALGNVVMETVQDILATSHQSEQPNKSSNDDKGSLPVSPNPSQVPSCSALTATNYDKNDNASDATLQPVNTEIEGVCGGDINLHASLTPSLRTCSPLPDTQPSEPGHQRAESVGTKLLQSPAKLNTVPCIYRRSSDSDLSITPKGNSLTGSDRSAGLNGCIKPNMSMFLRSTNPQDFDMLEYPFLTMSKYPTGFITQIGGAVSARSVKLLERISNFEEPESRDTWWSEIRMEIRSHARALNCNAVLGYVETTSICEDICVLSASGTAAVIGFHNDINEVKLYNKEYSEEKENKMPKIQEIKHNSVTESPDHEIINNHNINSCSVCHLPYNSKNIHIRATVLKCALCRSGKVPDVLIATIEMPDGTPTLGRGCFIQSFVCRPLKDLRGESNAKEISDGLPFLEYELHRSLVNKLKIKGMNAIFGLKVRISIGEKMLVGLATGTAMFLTPLPTPVLPKLVSDRTADEKKLADLQKLLNDTVRRNREIYQLKNIDDGFNGKVLSDDDSEDETPLDLSIGNKDCCILEVDDPQDAELVKILMEDRPPDGFHVVNTEFVPGLEELEIVKNLQMFTQVYRAKFQQPYNFDAHFHRLLQSVYFKLRRMVPCALCDLQFRVDLPETDEIQLCILGMALGLGDPQKHKFKKKNTITKRIGAEDDLIFNLEEDHVLEYGTSSKSQNTSHPHLNTTQIRSRQKSPLRNRNQTIKQRHMPYKERHGVDITPLSYVPGGKIEHYLGNLNFFFIRETTSIREEGGLSGFIHSFVTEVLAIVRAHVTALGGNAMVAYFMTECVLNHNLHKNQGQCLINVGGDVVIVSYFKEEQ